MADGFLSGLARRVGDWRDEAEDRAEPYLRDGRRRARRGGDDAVGELRHLWEQVEKIVERSVAPAARDTARSAGEAASDYAHQAGRAARHYGPRAVRAAQDYAPRAMRAARDYAPQAREAAESAAAYVRDATRARPLLAIGLAIGATWLVASMLSGDRRR